MSREFARFLIAFIFGLGFLTVLAQEPLPCGTGPGSIRCTPTPTRAGAFTATPTPGPPTPAPPTAVPPTPPPGSTPTPSATPVDSGATIKSASITVGKTPIGAYRYDSTGQLVTRDGLPVSLCFEFTDGTKLACSAVVRRAP